MIGRLGDGSGDHVRRSKGDEQEARRTIVSVAAYHHRAPQAYRRSAGEAIYVVPIFWLVSARRVQHCDGGVGGIDAAGTRPCDRERGGRRRHQRAPMGTNPITNL